MRIDTSCAWYDSKQSQVQWQQICILISICNTEQMRKFFTTLILLLLYTSRAALAQKQVTSRFIIVGNAGEVVKKDSLYLSTIRSTIPFDSNTTVVYLGDYTTSQN